MTAWEGRYTLDGLCCADCAEKIEREIRRLDGVSEASVNFASRVLTIGFTGEEPQEKISARAAEIAKRHDSDIELREMEAKEPGKKVLYLSGLDCADCARELEEAVRRLDGVRSAAVDFASQKLTLEAEDREELPAVVRRAARVIRETEPEIEISYARKAEGPSPDALRKHRLHRAGLIAGAVLFAAAMIFRPPLPVESALFLLSYLLVGGEVLLRAFRNVRRGRVFDENFLMSVATLGAFAIGEPAEGVAVMLFYQVGEFFQRLAVGRSRKSISALMDIRPDYANLKTEDGVRRVPPEEAGAGDLILVRPGERVPLDGRVVEGKSSLDTSALTGESLPRAVEPGAEILSGSVNQNGLLTVEVTKEFGESTVSRILDLVQNAGGRKAQAEAFITKFARYYTPAVVFAAAALAVIPPLAVPGASFSEWIGRALTFLVVSCPCALVISIPLSFFAGIGAASKRGILVKGGNFLEALNHVDTVVFDKTGTLTKGNFRVTRIVCGNGWPREKILDYAAHAEIHSNHPIAVSIREAYGREPDAGRVSDYEEISGKGVRVRVDGRTVLAGNGELMESEGVGRRVSGEAGTAVYLAVDGSFAGSILISDEIRPDSARAVRGLKAAGVRRIVMLTGDNRRTAERVAEETGMDAVYAELLPGQKVERIEELENDAADGGKVVFVGDGINDAPVLARADVGVAMGGLGSDAAIEAADVVLMTDEPARLETAIRVAKRTHAIVRQNIVFALGVKLVILILAAFGAAGMWEAVFGDVGVAVLAVLNAARAAQVRGTEIR